MEPDWDLPILVSRATASGVMLILKFQMSKSALTPVAIHLANLGAAGFSEHQRWDGIEAIGCRTNQVEHFLELN